MSEPVVTAMMVTGRDIARLPLVWAAVRSFHQQTWPYKELLIVTDGFTVLETMPAAYRRGVRELVVPDKLSLGQLRNLGLEAIETLWVMQWDDDDWSHPQRMQRQLALGRAEEAAVTLSHQVRYSFASKNAKLSEQPRQPSGELRGIPGTILHQRSAVRYLDMGKHEDSHFLNALPKVAVLNNQSGNGGPQLYLRFHHGAGNTWDEKHIMGRYAGSPKPWALPQAAEDYLKSVLKDEYPNFTGT